VPLLEAKKLTVKFLLLNWIQAVIKNR